MMNCTLILVMINNPYSMINAMISGCIGFKIRNQSLLNLAKIQA